MLTDEYLSDAERDARKFSGAYHGTSGTLAGHVIRLLNEIKLLRKPAPVPREQVRIIALAGPIGAGKSLAADMLADECGGVHVQWADPIYAGLATMLDVPESMLRDREKKELIIDWLGVSPRHLLRTSGTEWGRELVHPDIWLKLMDRRIDRLAAEGCGFVAICGTRFLNEADMVRSRGGEVWWIDRPVVSIGPPHVSDILLTADDCDRVIDNRYTADELRSSLDAALAAYSQARS